LLQYDRAFGCGRFVNESVIDNANDKRHYGCNDPD
jgi:hypothetical protein